MKWKFLVSIAALTSILVLPSCSPVLSTESGGTISTRVIVTRDFGHELILDETKRVPSGAPALEALKTVSEVETAYGGGFVEAIDGVRSGFTGSQPQKNDWFIYINGIESNAGALEYKLHDGDVQHWDFHDWGFHQFIPAIVGDFPEPFRHGYGGVIYPTIIVYQDGWQEDAKQIADYLKGLGVPNVSTKTAKEILEGEKDSANLVLLGTPDFPLIAELNRVWSRLGFYAYFQDGTLKVLDAKGETSAVYSTGAGLIQATQNPWNPNGTGASQNTVWTVSGPDTTGVKAAVSTLLNRNADFKYAYAAVIAEGKVIRIPH